MSTALVVSIVSIVIAVSGWVKFFYDILTINPKIKGRIFTVITTEIDNPEKQGERITVFLVYLYLTNHRKNSVHILNYELEINTGKGFEKLIRVYGVQKVENWKFGGHINIGNLREKLIYTGNRPLSYGVPVHGFVLFASNKLHEYYIERKKTTKYRVTVIDALKNKHSFISSKKEFEDMNLLSDLAGIEIKA